MSWLESRNSDLAGKPPGEWLGGAGGSRVTGSSALAKALAKASAQELYLGMGGAWLLDE